MRALRDRLGNLITKTEPDSRYSLIGQTLGACLADPTTAGSAEGPNPAGKTPLSHRPPKPTAAQHGGGRDWTHWGAAAGL